MKFEYVSNNPTDFKSFILNASLPTIIASAEPLQGGGRSKDNMQYNMVVN